MINHLVDMIVHFIAIRGIIYPCSYFTCHATQSYPAPPRSYRDCRGDDLICNPAIRAGSSGLTCAGRTGHQRSCADRPLDRDYARIRARRAIDGEQRK